ncbi:5-formyltetrahydrofolate cyclo-ligase [Rhodospirillaceae bacterium SYSU D60014]|uniref:5-formyltetrahydrofolate cyclo-ligase n=1 Tax=Virgifigura deserti TaxID=2268457 RepID=UPI000E662AE1
MESWDEIRRWRKTERAVMIERRLAASREDRARWNEAIAATIAQRLPQFRQMLVGFYWPFKGEFDARPLARALLKEGARFALPVVVEKAAPLIFREWWPGKTLTPGVWNIPVPAEGEPVTPEALLVPLVGFDQQGYRLGYGGGFYDRTLAAIMARTGSKPLTVGVGFELSQMATIHPQPVDIPMDLIITEARFDEVRPEGLLPLT